MRAALALGLLLAGKVTDSLGQGSLPAVTVAGTAAVMHPQIQAALISAVVALCIAIAPAVWRRLRPGRLDIEMGSAATLKQMGGRPGIQLHVLLSNLGGAAVKVLRMRVRIKRADDDPFEIRATGYFQKSDDRWAVLLAPFRLKANDEWSYHLTFANPPSRDDDIQWRDLSRKLELELREKIDDAAKAAPEGTKAPLVEGSASNWQPLVDQFNRNFRWKPGEYHATLYVDAKNKSWERSFRFTVFESDASELKVSDGYKYGFAVFIKHPVKRGAVDVDLVVA